MSDDPLTVIKNALIVGATANFRPNSMNIVITREVVEEYQALKTLLDRNHARVDADLLDIGPGSAARHEMLVQQLEQAGVAEDEEVVAQARKVLKTAARHDPQLLEATDPTESSPHT